MKEINGSTIIKVILIICLAIIIFKVAKILLDVLLFGIILYILSVIGENTPSSRNDKGIAQWVGRG